MIKQYIKTDSCPKTIVPYNGHQFIGKAQEEVLWWDYSSFVFDINTDSLYVTFWDNVTAWVWYNIWASTLDSLWGKIIDSYNDFVANSWNTTQISYTVSGWFLYITVVWTLNNNLQMTIRNDNSGIRADWSSDPESDWIEGREPTFFFISGNGKCEIIELWSDAFNCETDRVLFFREWVWQTINWEVFWWSSPEWVQWSNIPMWDNRSWTVFFDWLDTDWLWFTSSTPVTQSFTTFNALIDELNNQLATYWSTFRLLWSATWDRIFITQLNWTVIVWDSDPYLSANGYNNISLVIEDSVTGGDWLVKARNPKAFTVSNVETGWAWGMFHWQMPCASIVVPTPQISILSWFGTNWANEIQLVAKYNESDRWILDYEPEIYLYFKKKRRWSNAGWKHNIRYRHKLCHMPQSDWSFSTQSLKKDVNPRLNAVPDNRAVDTEWQVNPTQTEMTTIFTLKPFQFLWSIPYWDAWIGTFPIQKADWNKIWTWTTFPATFTTKKMTSQNDWLWRPITHMTAYFKTVIRNPKWGHPIESTESYPIIIYPDVHFNFTWDITEYAHWWVNINYNTR